jgi:outer membrane receptor protein involved in Fe transport
MIKSPTFRNNALRLGIAAALAAPVSPQVALAEKGALEEVVVTAQRRETSLQDTPIFVTALQADALEQRVIRNTEDLMSNIPGISGFSAPGARSATSLNLRGVSASNGANLSADPAVGLYFDGVYVGKMLASGMDVAEIERMEILRGPQGSLYGRNATAGAVSIVTRKPSGEAGMRAMAGYGNYDHMELKLNGDTPAFGEVGEGLGRVAASVGYHMRKRDGVTENDSGGDDFDQIDRYSWRVALNWQPTDSVEANYSYDATELDEVTELQKVVGFTPIDARGTDRYNFLRTTVLNTARFFSTIPGADPRIASRWLPSINQTIAAYGNALDRNQGRPDDGVVDVVPIADNSADGHTLNVDWDIGEAGAFGELTLRSITGFRQLETYVAGDLEDIDSSLNAQGIGAYNDLVHLTLLQIYGGTVAAGFPPVASPTVNNLWNFIDRLGTNHSNQDTRSEYEQFSQEFHLIGSAEQVDYLLGVQWFEDEGKYRRNSIFSAPLAGARAENYDNSTESLAIFAHASYKFAALDDRLVLTGGLRYTEEDKTIDYDYSANQTPFGNVPAQQLSLEDSFDNVSYDISLAYQITDDINAFVRNSTGYRSGGFNGEVFNNPYDEETIDQWEVGVKSTLWDQRVRFNASLFQYTADDLQVGVLRVVNGAVTSQLQNAAEAERWGADVELLVAPIDDLVLGLSYSYISGDFEKYPAVCNAATVPVCIDTDDIARRTSPANQLAMTADYTFLKTDVGDFNAYLQYNWQDESLRTSLTSGVINNVPYIYESPSLDPRNLLAARLSWRNIPVGNDSLQLTLWGKNLLDDDFPAFGINFASLGLITEQYVEPRTYGIEVSYEF